MKATAASLDHDSETLALVRKSIRRARCPHRSAVAEEIKKIFSPDGPLTVQWDGKIDPDLAGENVNRLAIQ